MSVQTMCSGPSALVPAGLRGYRMWKLTGPDHDPTLGATTFSRRSGWEAGEIAATCQRWGFRPGPEPVQHDAPQEGCTCGVYGWYRPDEARLHHGDIFGVVEASGRVLLGDFGFRAERAKVLALVSDSRYVQRRWAERGVAVFATKDALLAEYPPDDVETLLGRPIPDTPPVDDGMIMFTITANTQSFTTAMQQLSRAFGKTAAQAANQMVALHTAYSKALSEAGVAPKPLPDDPMERALALRRQRNTGPQNRRKGRARLEAAPNA